MIKIDHFELNTVKPLNSMHPFHIDTVHICSSNMKYNLSYIKQNWNYSLSENAYLHD